MNLLRICKQAATTLFTLSLLIGAQHAPASAVEVLHVGATPGENIELTRNRYQLIIDYIQKHTGIKTELYLATDYTGVIEAMRAGKIDVASFGPLSYVLASDVAGAEAFAKEYRAGAGSMYTGYIITRSDSPIQNIRDLKGHTFGFVDPASTGGNLIPRMNMLKNGIDPEKDLAAGIYLGSHDQVALAVAHKRVDAGAVMNFNFEAFLDRGTVSGDEFKIIHKSDPFPGSAWCFRKDLDQETRDKVKAAMFSITSESCPELKDFLRKIEKYQPAQDSDWDSLRETVHILNIDLKNSD